MTPKEFKKLLARDGNQCIHCGLDDDTLIPQHRINRGHGGSKQLNKPSNLVVLCSQFNGLIESNAGAAETARRYGWKLSRYDDPIIKPVYDLVAGCWWLLADDFTKSAFLD